MPFTIPSAVFDSYFEVVDELISNEFIGVDVTLYYPEKIVEVTDNANTLNLVNGPNTNFNRQGGLSPFNQTGGTSFSKVEQTESIRVRWYPDPKYWTKILSVSIPEVKVLIIAHLADWDKLVRANQIGYTVGGQIQKYVLATQLHSWGFGQRYIVGQLKEA